MFLNRQLSKIHRLQATADSHRHELQAVSQEMRAGDQSRTSAPLVTIALAATAGVIAAAPNNATLRKAGRWSARALETTRLIAGIGLNIRATLELLGNHQEVSHHGRR